MVIVVLVESKATVAARVVARLVQIDEHFGVAEGTSATVARHEAVLDRGGWNLGDEVNSETGVHLWRQ